MIVKDLARPLPGVRRFSILRQRIGFGGSASFWEQNYARGDTSGAGSYGALGMGKANFLNGFIRDRGVQSVIEFGCGDGHQLSLAMYPTYIGLDVSRAAIRLCRRRFSEDASKSFFLYDGQCFIDSNKLFRSEAALSLDVIYHLVEDAVFETYMRHLFAASMRYVIIYSTDMIMKGTAPHVRHRKFTDWVTQNCPQWHLLLKERGPDSGPGRADFFVYEKVDPNKSESCRIASRITEL